MEHEKIYSRDGGNHLKITATLRLGDLIDRQHKWSYTVEYRRKGARKWQNGEHAAVSRLDIKETQMELWEKLKPT